MDEGKSEWWKWAMGGVVGFGVCTIVLKELQSPKPKTVDLSGLNVSVHVAALNEEAYIREALDSLNRQDLRPNFKLVLLDCYSTDRTVEIASPLVDEVFYTPRWKLSARNYGFEIDSADIIVAADADSFYPPYWLNNLLEPFSQPDVVAVHGPRFSEGLLTVGSVWFNLARPVIPRFSGGNSAIRRDAFRSIGGFDTSVEHDWGAVLREEEVELPKRLARVGRVVYAWGAGSHSSARYLFDHHKRLERMDSSYPDI